MERDLGKDKSLEEDRGKYKDWRVILEAPVPLERHLVTYSEHAVYCRYRTCALMSLPMSRSSLTVAVCPFMAASISGVIPNLLPVLEREREGERERALFRKDTL